MTKSSRRSLLVAVAVALLAANAWWFFLRTPEPQRPAFELGSTGGLSVNVDAPAAASAPLFDPVHDGWTVGTDAVQDLPSRVRRSAPADTAPVVDFLMVRLADDANSEQVRRALLSLARQRICFVALVDEAGLPKDGRYAATPVHRIVSVRGNDGEQVGCAPLQNPAAASKATI
ncbi:hypothetical protein [Novosphingobium sp. P6W]|uniref:hypothetical protein n=1 Tax=Novosphingobium sp. P6W TaxID=1609758 RepID=UPI0005C315F8|nr:hypothetical protein [Novosphingobium sp. P6W]AXB76318.1 hypothetical protein TQ38_007195 [Novosphingobium sp. P6W]KIS32175.1 hypothetical protein TQ38_13600 [Novosphingobium sp. P6W]